MIRFLTRQLTLLLFGGLLVLLPMVSAIVMTVGSPEKLKSTAADSGVYKVFVSSVLAESAKQTDDTNAQDVLKDEGVRQAATAAFTPKVLQDASENVIDGTYAWLNQQTSTLQFSIDLTRPKEQFIANLTDYAKKRANSLPRCTLNQLQQLRNTEDILSIECLPAGVDPNKAAEQFGQDFVKNADFLTDPVITAKDLPKDNQGRTFDQQAAGLPGMFGTLKALPWILGGLIIIVGLCTILLFEDRRIGTKRIAWSLFGTGLLLLLGLLVYSFVLRNFAQNTIGISDPEFRRTAADALSSLLGSFLRHVGTFGGAYVGIAAVLLLVQSRYKPQPVIGETTTQTATVVTDRDDPDVPTQPSKIDDQPDQVVNKEEGTK